MPPLAKFKDLCMDAETPIVLASFWSAVLGLSPSDAGGRDLVLRGEHAAQTMWINRVPDPKTVKHRIHLDIEVGELEGLRALGATVLREPTDTDHWWVMADPEGGEFCAFVRPERGSLPGRLYQLVIDSADPIEQRAWWGKTLGLPVYEPDDRYAALDGDGRLPFDNMCFLPVPEPKTGKDRIHVDVTTSDVAALVQAGAVVLREPDDEIRWHVLADPEGNEFCAFTE